MKNSTNLVGTMDIAQSLMKTFQEEDTRKMTSIVRKTAKVLGFELKRGRTGTQYDAIQQKKIVEYIKDNYCVTN